MQMNKWEKKDILKEKLYLLKLGCLTVSWQSSPAISCSITKYVPVATTKFNTLIKPTNQYSSTSSWLSVKFNT